VRDLEPAGEGWIWLDRRKTTRFRLEPGGKVAAAERNGAPSNWVSCGEIDRPLPPGANPVYWARPGTTLKTVILAMHKSGTAPVALFDEDERFVGAIGVRNVLQAILRRND